MSKREILERESRLALPVALCAIFAPVLIVGSLVLAGQLDLPTTGLATESLRAFDANQGALLALAVMRAIGFLLLIPPLWFLFTATKARRPELPRGDDRLCLHRPGPARASRGSSATSASRRSPPTSSTHTSPAAISTPCSTT